MGQKLKHLLIVFGTAALVSLAIAFAYEMTDSSRHNSSQFVANVHKLERENKQLKKHKDIQHKANEDIIELPPPVVIKDCENHEVKTKECKTNYVKERQCDKIEPKRKSKKLRKLKK